MRYNPPATNLLTVVTFGSHLYGTNSETSDHDFKAVYLPDLRDLILAKQPHTMRYRFDAEGNTLSDSSTMPPNGYEAEHTPVQKFVHDFLGGQAYAVETVFAVVQGAHLKHLPEAGTVMSKRFCEFEFLCHRLAKNFVHRNVNGMVGFAVKQTFDYVRRGERLNAANKLLGVLYATQLYHSSDNKNVRLDTVITDGDIRDAVVQETVLDKVLRLTDLECGETTNQNKKMRTLKLNGREYLETTTLSHLITAVEKMRDQYGERSTRASETDVDWKSLSHAVRVYQQVIELLKTGFIKFPRPNAQYLLQIKEGKHNLEDVKALLRNLDDEVTSLLENTTLPIVDEEFRARVEQVLLEWLLKQYDQ